VRGQVIVAVRLMVVATIIGLGYSLFATLGASVLFPDQASGSQLRRNGHVVGSRLVGQPFTKPRYFHPRPSASGYDGAASGAANLGPSNPELIRTVAKLAREYREENGLAPDVAVPVDAVTSSASGLDPDISVANARLQAARVARARGLSARLANDLIDRHTANPTLELGSPAVNVLELNLDLDRRGEQ
jgi:K+-transporting ATPase ATPase C chain